MEKTIRYTSDTLPPLTAKDREELKRLAEMPDDQINYDDIPELTDAQLAAMKRGEPIQREPHRR